MSHPKMQHYVPQFLLRNFSTDKEHLYCFDKTNGKLFTRNIDEIGGENYFYDLVNGNPEYSMEYPIGEVEDKAAIGIAKLLETKNLRLLKIDEYKDIALFTALQMVRTKQSREEILYMNRYIAEMIRKEGQDPNSVKNFHEITNPDEAKQISLKNLTLASDLYPYLMNKRWILYTSNDEFKISDNPVVKQNTTNKSENRGVLGLNCKGIEIYFPLSSSLVLSFLCEETFQQMAYAYETKRSELESKGLFYTGNFINSVRRKLPIQYSEANVNNINSLQAIFSERFIYSRNDDFSLSIDMIKENEKLRKGLRPLIGQKDC